MKPSGVEWIGDVPEGWEVKRLKYLLDIQSESSASSRKVGLENIESFTGRYLESNEDFAGNGLAFAIGDILYGKLRPYLCKVWVAEFEGNAVGDFIVYRTRNNFNTFFAKYLLMSSMVTDLCNSATYGAKMPRVSPTFMASLRLPFPPLSEQKRIAAYLDERCGKIDALKGKIEKQIETLGEYKKSLITECVTKGLKRGRKMKPSGIEWIGDVPKEWEVNRLKYLLDIQSESSASSRKVGLENIESFTGRYLESNEDFAGNGLAFAIGDILYGKLRPYLCKVWVAEFEGNAVGDFIVYRTRNNFNTHFAKYLLMSSMVTDLCNSATYGAKMPRVSPTFMASLRLPLPPLSEQKEIAAYLDRKCAAVDAAVASCRKQLEALAEYRKSLIYECVTGKRDVA